MQCINWTEDVKHSRFDCHCHTNVNAYDSQIPSMLANFWILNTNIPIDKIFYFRNEQVTKVRGSTTEEEVLGLEQSLERHAYG